MPAIRAYLSHPIRGVKGAAATREDMEANNRMACEFAAMIRVAYPNLDLYVPAEHDEFIMLAYERGILTERDILSVDCDLVSRRDLLIMWLPDMHVSSGMWQEMREADRVGISIVWVKDDLSPIGRALEAFGR